MPNEFVARNGVIALNNSVVTGSLNVTNGITGSLFGTSSWAVTASFALNGGSGTTGASYTLTQSSASSTWTVNHGLANLFPVITVYDSNGFVLIPQNISSSTANQTIITFSYPATGYATVVVQGTTVTTASYANTSISSSFSSTASYVNPLNQPVIITGSLRLSGSAIITGSLNVSGSITGSLLGTSSFALTASSADNFTVRGTLTAQTIVVQTITSSTDFVTGSTRFGTLSTNTHQFTGSVSVSGSITGSRVNPRSVTTASTATFTPDINTGDVFTITAQAASLAFANPTGNPVEGQRMIIRVKDNGTARALSFSGSQYRASSDLAFPASSSASKTLYLGFVYNSVDTKWDLLASLDNFT